MLPTGDFYPWLIQTHQIGQGARGLKKTVPSPPGWWFARIKHHILLRQRWQRFSEYKIQFSNDFIYGSWSQKLSRFKRAPLALILLHSSCSLVTLFANRTSWSYQGTITGLHLCFFSPTSTWRAGYEEIGNIYRQRLALPLLRCVRPQWQCVVTSWRHSMLLCWRTSSCKNKLQTWRVPHLRKV